MILLKSGVSLRNLQPQVILAMMVVRDYFTDKGIKNFTVTSCNDGTHMKGSLHYEGRAFDTRTHDISLTNRTAWLEQMRNDIKNALGNEFDVILEDVGGANEHLHIEFDPKVPITPVPRPIT